MVMKSMPSGDKAQQRRDQLLAATASVLRRGGVETASVRAVAREANVSVGSVLYYFETFDELLAAAMDNVLGEFYSRRLKVVAAPGPPAARLARMIRLGVPDVISDDLSLLYGSVALARNNAALRPAHTGILERQVGLYRAIIDAGVESRAISRPSRRSGSSRRISSRWRTPLISTP